MKQKKYILTIATTTSVHNTGLLDLLINKYTKDTPYNVRVTVLPVGTGRAVKLARHGEADLILVHDPFVENKFISLGYGVNKRVVMYNEFVVLGPRKDPAQIQKAKSATEAFKKIAKAGAFFISRADDSGTHHKELDLWEDAGINPKGKGWYYEADTSMDQTILSANKQKAYTLSDMGTYIALKDKVTLKVLYKGDPLLKNLYSLIAVNPGKVKGVNYRVAIDFIGFVTSVEGQKIISEYKIKKTNPFYPASFK